MPILQCPTGQLLSVDLPRETNELFSLQMEEQGDTSKYPRHVLA